MTRRIAIFPNGSPGVIDTNSNITVKIDGEEASSFKELNDKNLKKYFPGIEPQDILKIKE